MRLGLSTAKEVDSGLAGRLAWLTGLRLLFLTLLLVATATLYLGGGGLSQYPLSLRVVIFTIGGGYALGILYAVVLRTGKRLRDLAFAQIVLDQLTWTVIVYVSGGATSGATSFYALTCLLGAILVGLRGAAVAAISGMAAYAALCAAFRFGLILPPHDQAAAYALGSAELVYPLLVNALGIGVVALLASYLAERVRLTGGALEAATLRAQEAERLAVLGRIAAGLAHEIRNPLGSIRGSIEMLRESASFSEDDRHLCDIIQREAARLNNLVGDMMDLAKPRSPREEAADVAALAREVVALAARAERGSDVSVIYEGPAGGVRARCDGAQMRQVVWNLVRNAVQASAAGTTVTVRVEPGDQEMVLSVDDHGPGIPGDDQKRIFDAFYTTRSHGAGIGLAVVKRIIDDHAPMGARIAVESPEGGGASFQVTLSTRVRGLRQSVRPPP